MHVHLTNKVAAGEKLRVVTETAADLALRAAEYAKITSDAVVYFKDSNIVHTGDTYFNGVYPYIDVNSGGSIDRMIELYSQLFEIINDETIIIPGHGPVSDIQEMRSYQSLLSEIRGRVADGMKNGKSLDDLVNENILFDLDPI